MWKDEIQDAIDAIEKAYEDEIKPIQDVSDELERQAKLEDLLAAKKAAAKEKERVALNALYKNGYTMSQTNAASGYQVHLVGQKKGISEMYILIDKQYNIKQVKMKQGKNWITINISSFKQQSFSDSDFRFKAKDYPTAEVIDLR